MQKLSRFAVTATILALLAPLPIVNYSCAFAQDLTTISDEAQMLYEDAIEQNKKGKKQEAIDSYIKALRKDRAVLALDDEGLIEASFSECVKKLESSPNDVKLLETCGFLASVGFSDNKTAISYYQRIVDLVDDESVKERTENLIERLKATAEAQQDYDRAVAASMRDERIKAWAELEKLEDSREERDKANERSERLSNAYSEKEDLQNRIPQLEDELNEIQEAYDKADRLWYTLKDELYERRRRRLKNDLAAKKEELEKAKNELKSIEKEVKTLEKEDNEFKAQKENSPFNQLDGDVEPEDEDSVFNEDPSNKSKSKSSKSGSLDESNSDEDVENTSSDDDSEDEYSEEALRRQAEEMSDDERQEQLDDLIDNL